MTVHSRSVIAKQRLGHKRRSLAVLKRSVLDDVLENLQIVGRAQHAGETKIDFALTGGGNFVVQALDVDAAVRERQRNLRSDIDQSVGGRTGNVALFRANAMAEIWSAVIRLAAAVPMALV